MRGWNDFITIKKILDDLHITFFMHSGSALGIYRDGNIMVDGSHSLGFGVFGLKYLKQIREKLEEKGFTINPYFEWEKRGNKVPMTTMLEFKREVNGFVYFFVKDPECYRAYLDPEHPYVSFPLEFSELEKFKINEVEINLLKPIEDYLVWVFGKTWRVKDSIPSYPPRQGK
jgi:hypothetical protein